MYVQQYYLCKLIYDCILSPWQILACAPSNIAVDNLVERLAQHKQKVVRLGHPARVLPHIQKYSLDAILSSSEETRLVEDVRKDLDKNLVIVWSKLRAAIPGWTILNFMQIYLFSLSVQSAIRKTRDHGEKQKIREDVKYLRKELRQREEAASKEVLKRADVVLATLSSADPRGPIRYLDNEHFDLVVIDECSQVNCRKISAFWFWMPK